jgi:hypothetical protein
MVQRNFALPWLPLVRASIEGAGILRAQRYCREQLHAIWRLGFDCTSEKRYCMDSEKPHGNATANWNERLRVVEAALLKLRVSSPSKVDAFQRRTCDAA